MPVPPKTATPPTTAAETPPNAPSFSSMSSVLTSLERWRLTQSTADAQTNARKDSVKNTNDTQKLEEGTRIRQPPQLVASTEEAASKVSASHNTPLHKAGTSDFYPFVERSYHPIGLNGVRDSLSDSSIRSEKDSAIVEHQGKRGQHATVGDEPAQWLFSSSSLPSDGQRLNEERNGDLPTVIAAAVPCIAQQRNSAAEAIAGRWTDEVKRSTAHEEELIRAYHQIRHELHSAEKRVAVAEQQQQREVNALKAQLQSEKEARWKAEQDREELLNQATVSPTLSPRTNAMAGGGGGVLHVSVEDGRRPHSPRNGGDNAAADNGNGCAEGGNGTTTTATTYISEAFYEKLKEREDRARARVRKEFVRQAQENLYAEQKKAAEAERTAALATRRLQQVEEDLTKAQDALQDALSVMEAKDVQLHERAIHIQELEAQLRLLQRQLESVEEGKAQADQQARRKIEETQKLADMRQEELEAQRHFAQQLQVQLGLKTRDLFDQESNQEGVLQQVLALQTRCKALEGDLETAVQEATALLDQRRQRAEADASVLREQNEKLKRRCAAAEGEVASTKGKKESDAKEMALLRQRYEKDLSDQQVEVRSLQLQLERVLDALNHKSAESITSAEIERQQQAALLRKYAAEATATHEELDRTRAMAQRENEKHLRTILELSQQLTALKQANTRLEHKVNIYDHESADATRLLTRAREELSQLREERQRLNVSLVDFREDSYTRSVRDGPDVLQRRVAELENVRRDLSRKLLQANQIIENLQGRVPYVMEQRNRYLQNVRLNPPVHGGLLIEAPPQPSSGALQSEGHDDARDNMNISIYNSGSSMSYANSKSRQPSRASAAPTMASLGLPELLESMVEKLEPILHPLLSSNRCCPLKEDEEGRSSSRTLSSALPLTLRERRPQQQQDQQQTTPLSPEEREALNRVLASCTAALRCTAKPQHIVDSPLKPFLGSQENTDKQLEMHRNETDPPSTTAIAGGAANKSSTLPTQRRASKNLRELPLQQNSYSGAPKADLPAPQGILPRPRRSSQPGISSTATDDSTEHLSHTSEGTSTRLSCQRAVVANTSPERISHEKAKDEELARRRGDNTMRHDNRDELEPELCWDSHEWEEVNTSHGTVSGACTPRETRREQQPPPSRLQRSAASATAPSANFSEMPATRDEPCYRAESKSPMFDGSAASSVTATTTGTQGDGVLRYSLISEEALSPIPHESSPEDVDVQPAVLDDDVMPILFSNVRCASAESSLPRSSYRRYPQQSSPTASTHSRTQYRAAIPDNALVIDVRRSTPPRRRGDSTAY